MTNDLKATLDELGGGYGGLVERLKASRELDVQPRRKWRTAASAMLAASCAGCLITVVALKKPSPAAERTSPFYLAEQSSSDPAALREIIRTQNADGSWANDFLTRQNLAVLRDQQTDEARLAYRKALRNLRMRNIES